ncbi:M14 family metallopeptidase [Paraburkholderia agricolaris]|uniref:M14 family metallopeptidase n=1 Tax=Paraburkholderia agricolaris TaxID=2152888 RepID=UPI001290CF63|nr:M14 family metallopeptidase [Paraburkholderia agricolaris]
MTVQNYFSDTYVEAREKFLGASQALDLTVGRVFHPSRLGPDGEALSIDSALLSPGNARSVLVITSGTHGVEGFCGSGCQVGLLSDTDFLAELRDRAVALLLIHAANPYGFAHLRRVNEDNVDLNRNGVDFSTATGANPDYPELDALLLPETWPPTDADNDALAGYIRQHGERKLRETATKGQYEVPDGMFYGGTSRCWSTREIKAMLGAHLPNFDRLAWVDIHTGLGAHGHGEKIFMRDDPSELQRARNWWGADVKQIVDPRSVSAVIDGPLMNTVYEGFPTVEKTTLGLEFGTYETSRVLHALRADHWLHRHADVSAEQAQQIGRDLKDVFYCDNDAWKGMAFAQTRVVALQAILGLSGQGGRT